MIQKFTAEIAYTPYPTHLSVFQALLLFSLVSFSSEWPQSFPHDYRLQFVAGQHNGSCPFFAAHPVTNTKAQIRV